MLLPCVTIVGVYTVSHVMIDHEGITWDRCGNPRPNGTNIAGVTFNGASNILTKTGRLIF